MEQKPETELEFKDKLNNFYTFHKVKIFILIFISIVVFISIIFIQQKNEKNNYLISEKYVQAGINISLDKREEAIKLYEEIILSQNKFYSILALNTVIEKNLITDNNKIIQYLELMEKIAKTNDQKDLIILKKSLFYLKNSEVKKGENFLRDLINKDSKYKKIAQEIIAN